MSDLGDFDQCLGIRFKSRFNDNEEDFRGQYCGVALRMPLPPKPEVIRKDVFIVNPDHFSNVSCVSRLSSALEFNSCDAIEPSLQ